MLSEVRKYGIGMVLAHQYLSQVATEVRDAVLGNVGSLLPSEWELTMPPSLPESLPRPLRPRT